MPNDKPAPDARVLLQDYIAARRGQRLALDASRKADTDLRAANDAAAKATVALGSLLPEKDPARRTFTCGGYTILVERERPFGLVEVASIPQGATEDL